MNIFVAKMSSDTTGHDLATLFEKHGTVLSAKVIMDRTTGHSKGFGFVEMKDEVEGLNAIDALNDTEFQGRKIVVKKALARGGSEQHHSRRFTSRLPKNPYTE